MFQSNNSANPLSPQSASLLLSILQSKAGDRWGRALDELGAKRLHVEGEFPEFTVTNKSGVRYRVTLDTKGNGSCTCPDFQVRTSQVGGLCKHVAAAAISSLVPLIPATQTSSSGYRSTTNERLTSAKGQTIPFVFRFRTGIRNGNSAKGGLILEVEGPLTGSDMEDQEAVKAAQQLLNRLSASIPPTSDAPPDSYTPPARSTAQTSSTQPSPSTPKNGDIPAVISKIDRMKTRRGDSFFLHVQAGSEAVRVFGTPEELAERLEECGYDVPASEIQAGTDLNLPCRIVLGSGANGYKTIEKFLPETA
jgi:hypothetical protein